MRANQRTVTVGSCSSRPEAELKRHVLMDAGIETLFAADDAGGLHPEMAFAYCGAYRLLVPEDRVDEAADLLASFDLAQPGDEPSDPSPALTADRPGHAADEARVTRRRGITFWAAVVMAAVLLAAAIANTVNVFTGL